MFIMLIYILSHREFYMSTKWFEPHKVKRVTVTDARDYWKYFEVIRNDWKVWHIVWEAFSFVDVWGRYIFKIFPFYALPIQLELVTKNDLYYKR